MPETTNRPRAPIRTAISTAQWARGSLPVRWRATAVGYLSWPGGVESEVLVLTARPRPVAACSLGSLTARGLGFFGAACGFLALVVACELACGAVELPLLAVLFVGTVVAAAGLDALEPVEGVIDDSATRERMGGRA